MCIRVSRTAKFVKQKRGGSIKEVPGSGFCLKKKKPCEGEDLECEEREERKKA
jgi:hypothetical protein